MSGVVGIGRGLARQDVPETFQHRVSRDPLAPESESVIELNIFRKSYVVEILDPSFMYKLSDVLRVPDASKEFLLLTDPVVSATSFLSAGAREVAMERLQVLADFLCGGVDLVAFLGRVQGSTIS